MYSDFAIVDIRLNEDICNSTRTCYRHFYFSKDASPRRTMVPAKVRLVIAKMCCAVNFIPVMSIAVYRHRCTCYFIFYHYEQYILTFMDILGDVYGKGRKKAFVTPRHSTVYIHFGNIVHRLKIKDIIFSIFPFIKRNFRAVKGVPSAVRTDIMGDFYLFPLPLTV